MNDLIFMVMEENIRPKPRTESMPWFVVLSERQRTSVCHWISNRAGIAQDKVPFFTTRFITLVVFIVLAFVFAYRALRTEDERLLANILEAAFLTVAWFWLLSPTQNPWYWTWALPLIPFARNRMWLVMGGLVMVYYLRFWMRYEFGTVDIWGTGYKGADFFDFVIVWAEYLPWFVGLALYRFWRRPHDG